MRIGIMTVILLVLFLYGGLSAELAVTVYNQNLALVKDKRALEFEKGRFEYSLTNVPSQIDPTSVHFKLLRNKDDAALLEQNYRYDLVGFGKIMEKYLDKEIEMIHENGIVYSGTLLAFDGKTVTLLKPSGALEVLVTEKVTKFDFPTLPEGLITKPTLVWLFDSELTGKQEAEISYMTKGMDWHAEYVGVVSEDEKMLDLAAWVSVENNSGATYKDAKLKLVAGDVNIIQPQIRGLGRMEKEMYADFAAAPGFEEKAFFEYHLYTLPRATDLANNEIKQISLFEPATTPVTKKYVYEGSSGNNDVKVNLQFVNSKQNGLGMPMPAGKVRVMKRDTDGSMEFIGENMIDHTPRDEKLELYMGNAFDLVGERVVKDTRKISQYVQENDIEVKLRNRKEDETVEIIVRERIYSRDWRILKSNFEYEKIDARTLEFKIPVKPGEEIVLSYTVRQEG
jgi:hypothetical protein